MAVSDLEAKIRTEAFKDIPKRLQAVTARIEGDEAARPAATSGHDAIEKELLYIERVVAAMPQRANARKKYLDQLAALRARTAPQQAQEAAPGSVTKRKKVGDFLAESGIVSPGIDQLRDPTKLQRLRSQRSGLAGAQRGQRPGGDPSSWRSAGTPVTPTSNSSAASGPESRIANFLMPELPMGEGDDAVRLLACEKELTPMLGRCQTVMVPEQDKTLLIRAWIEEDNQQEQVAFMELGKDAALLREVAQEVAQQVDNGQEALDNVQAQASKSKDATDKAVAAVTGAAKAKYWICNLIGPVIGLLIAILGGLWAKLEGHTILVPVVVGIVVGGVVFFVSRKFINWRLRTMQAIEKDVGRVNAWTPLPPTVAKEVRGAGLAVQERLTEVIGSTAWTPERTVRGWQVESAASCNEAQSDLHAFKIQFDARVSARVAFDELERLRIEGKLDPRCKAMWSRPVDSDGTHIRYSNHSFLLKNREFLTVCRCAKARSADPSREAYVCAAASLSEELTALVEPDKPKKLVHRGLVHLTGASVVDIDTDSCHVEVLTDIDPQLFGCLSSFWSERTARYHVYLIASELERALRVKADGSTVGSYMRIGDDASDVKVSRG